MLEILARQAQHSLPMFDLQTLSGMEPSRYAEVLKSLQSEGWIEFVGEGVAGAIRLTPSGERVVQLARPA